MSKLHKALIVSCLQNDFLDWGSLGIQGANELVEFANHQMPQFETVIAIQDWHPATHQSFAANHPWRKPGQVMKIDGKEQLLWTMHCIQDTFGAELAVDLADENITAVFQKGLHPNIESLSPFLDESGNKASNINDFLQEKEVDSIYLMGLLTEYDIQKTAIDARNFGYEVKIFSAGCRAFDTAPAISEQVFKNLQNVGAVII